MMSISPCIRQLLVIGACLLATLSVGCAMGYPMVLLLQLREDNSPITLNLDTATWIGSVHGLAGVLSIFVSILMQSKGRKIAFITSCTITIVGWGIAYSATSVTMILISETFHGCGINALSTISYLTMSEMIAPKYRNLAVQSSCVLNGLGISMSGVMSRFLHWKTICLVSCIPCIIALLASFLWPESPPWLASQGRFLECQDAFKLLRTMSDCSKKELEQLIEAQKLNLSLENNHKQSMALFWEKLKRRDFYLPTIHIFLLLHLTYWSGSVVLLIDSLEVMQQTTSNDRAIFVSGIILNVAFFGGMCISNVLSKRFKNKTIILSTAASAASCLIGLSVVNLLQTFNIITKDSIIGLFFIIANVTIAGLGMLSVVFTVTSEIMPVKYRGTGGAMYIIFCSILYASSLKISPYLFVYISLWGTLLLFALNISVCGLLIWRYVPETKNRTLQEIEDFYINGNFLENRLNSNEAEHFITGKAFIQVTK